MGAHMAADILDIRRRLLSARRSLDVAWSTWAGMITPESVKLRARIVVGEDWLQMHLSPGDQAMGLELLGKLRAQAHNEELAEAEPGRKQNARRAWDAAESRFLAAESEYLRLVRDARKQGIEEDDGE